MTLRITQPKKFHRDNVKASERVLNNRFSLYFLALQSVSELNFSASLLLLLTTIILLNLSFELFLNNIENSCFKQRH